MLKKVIALENKFWLFILMVSCSLRAQSQNQFYAAKDFTKENLFTKNIEGPNFDSKGNLYVVNFEKNGTIGIVKPDGSASLFVELPAGSTANAIMFDTQGDMLLADWTGHNILKVNMQTKAVSVYSHNDQFNQPNDITINKKGQLFASDPNWKDSTGKLWRINSDGTSTLLQENIGTTNGIELSPDEKTLYVNESIQRKIWAYPVDASGNIGSRKLFYEFADFGLDGMKCDRKGNLYVTRHGKGTVVILSPEGKLLREVTMKGSKPSNIIFGGPGKKNCYVTLQDRGCVEIFKSKIAGRR